MFHDCPQCNAPAELLDRWTWESTDGPVEHVKIRCPIGHWFAMPAWMLDEEVPAPARSVRA